MNINSKYYTDNADIFIEGTIKCDMSLQYKFFEKHLKDNAKLILDLGFGSGRDSLHFSQNYNVYAIDPVEEFCSRAKQLGLENVFCMSAQDINFMNMFDGIWACASLLHVPSFELQEVFKKCCNALKDDGVMYCSFKYGEYEGERNGRYFTDLNEQKLKDILKNTNLNIIEICITEDVRPDRNEEWLNVILKKF